MILRKISYSKMETKLKFGLAIYYFGTSCLSVQSKLKKTWIFLKANIIDI